MRGAGKKLGAAAAGGEAGAGWLAAAALALVAAAWLASNPAALPQWKGGAKGAGGWGATAAGLLMFTVVVLGLMGGSGRKGARKGRLGATETEGEETAWGAVDLKK